MSDQVSTMGVAPAMSLEDVRIFLRSARTRTNSATSEAATGCVFALKRDAVQRGDELEAKALWCLEQALHAQDSYLNAFQKLKSQRFYDAWCDLEQAENTLVCMERHDQIGGRQFHLDFIREYVAKWQSLFPYKMFMSPELLALEKLCSICKRPISPRKPCGHRVGEIYGGEMCGRIVSDLRLLGMSLVTNPVQKYSVAFLPDPEGGDRRDHYNYALVKYAISALRTPFDEWSIERSTRRQPLNRFQDVGRNDPCPCESGRKFKKCCLPHGGVLRPHVQFTFANVPWTRRSESDPLAAQKVIHLEA